MKEFSHDEQVSLTSIIITLLNDWRVTNADKIRLLALPAKTRSRSLNQYQDGVPLPFDEAVYQRIEHFVGIAQALRLANPRNVEAGTMWLHRPHRRFGERTPLAVMLEDGLNGIVNIRKEVDCSYDWFTDELDSRAK